MKHLRDFIRQHRIVKKVLANYWGLTQNTMTNRCNDDTYMVDKNGRLYRVIGDIPKHLMKGESDERKD